MFRSVGINRMRYVMNSSMTRSLSSTARTQAQGRIGPSWTIAEIKRLTPTLIGWASFLTVTLGWPFGIYFWKKPN
ncbi:uncharacterized protein GVI51_B01749 [Nakaseomyces glabratus]|uniref:Cytochrome c oxidase polypeptide VIII, mitochondrial n=1 Tax=Candida glabrata (strain ATCC 2001 / BCRC 20586 / JCM 3761 / NBRC 0622 / NRRL Y-65 / CBS 138) TaxID=284593 RepID=B4UMX5_CANGA|nr:uncharacterized protein CAGL0B01875g [Nakaseomyces glabratus]KAH7609082.1 hypothetical protein J7293_00285 [Nakaseomyces glabratus]KAH7609957.1 hypothetical protein J7294_00285 [Nakaseomyces glabratus]QHS64669.1 uncharacterized protein GVI51_B01749 [Nakaseomyces glabratus]CAR57999.1 unnamed protein product [Nakaseomyces glabratus]|eukprot:XP_002999516.1 uncharacterized protein CAGL0B01875g [[Candida] glabrata]